MASCSAVPSSRLKLRSWRSARPRCICTTSWGARCCESGNVYVIRTEKRAAIDATCASLFKPRQTRLTPVARDDRHHKQRTLYEAVTAYVRHGYSQALQNKQRHIGFLMILMQRLVTSSTAAIFAGVMPRHLKNLASTQRELAAVRSSTQRQGSTVGVDKKLTQTADFG